MGANNRSNKIDLADATRSSPLLIVFQQDGQIGVFGEAGFHANPKFSMQLAIRDDHAKVRSNMLAAEHRSPGWKQSRKGAYLVPSSISKKRHRGGVRETGTNKKYEVSQAMFCSIFYKIKSDQFGEQTLIDDSDDQKGQTTNISAGHLIHHEHFRQEKCIQEDPMEKSGINKSFPVPSDLRAPISPASDSVSLFLCLFFPIFHQNCMMNIVKYCRRREFAHFKRIWPASRPALSVG
jgi:hypothetical protein